MSHRLQVAGLQITYLCLPRHPGGTPPYFWGEKQKREKCEAHRFEGLSEHWEKRAIIVRRPQPTILIDYCMCFAA